MCMCVRVCCGSQVLVRGYGAPGGLVRGTGVVSGGDVVGGATNGARSWPGRPPKSARNTSTDDSGAPLGELHTDSEFLLQWSGCAKLDAVAYTPHTHTHTQPHTCTQHSTKHTQTHTHTHRSYTPQHLNQHRHTEGFEKSGGIATYTPPTTAKYPLVAATV